METLRILHNEAPDARGLIVDAQLDIDDVEALLEPGLVGGLAWGALALLALGLRRDRGSGQLT